ncbi:hypothetical protein F4803DRAFT_531039 [Xylaria telfairii]|nr:hypothetical protein F4803DRAFT_531039 [Xylaria telfairii]
MPERILRRRIGPALLPYSIAVLEASRMPKTHSPSSIQQLLDALYNDPGSLLVCRLRGRPLGDLEEMVKTHEMVKNHANASALTSWGSIVRFSSLSRLMF